jgi:hypothetical protein
MKTRLPLALAVFGVLAIVLWITGRKSRQEAEPVPAPSHTAQHTAGSTMPGTTVTDALPVRSRQKATTQEMAFVSSRILPTNPAGARESMSLETELEVIATVIRDYRLTFGQNPVGSNAEITKTLGGDNPKHVNFLSSPVGRLNEKGELVDRWNRPYFFHQISGKEMEIRSAGPDQRMWTGDDQWMR